MARLISARADPLVQEGFFKHTDEVRAHVEKMHTLYRNPSLKELRLELGIDDDILGEKIREQELRNWIDYLILPYKRS
jgi:hypothetical protein